MSYRKEIDEAIRLRDEDKVAEFGARVKATIDKIPAIDVTSLCAVGAILIENKDYADALKCFSVAVENHPLSASASIGLFHALWNTERREEAFAELRRFLSISESEEHFRLIEEMRDAIDSV
ncbi:MAG: hypothetical protein ABI878_11495 [Acidobacteriota bacterium]